MDYLDIILKGYLNPDTNKFLHRYFVRESKEAEKDGYQSDEFFEGVFSAIQRVEGFFKERLYDRHTKLRKELGAIKEGRVKLDESYYPELPQEERLKQVATEWEQQNNSLKISDFYINLSPITNGKYCHQLAYEELEYIRKAVQDAKATSEQEADKDKEEIGVKSGEASTGGQLEYFRTIILDGYSDEVIKSDLTSYYVRMFRKAATEQHYSVKEFFEGCYTALGSFIQDSDKYVAEADELNQTMKAKLGAIDELDSVTIAALEDRMKNLKALEKKIDSYPTNQQFQSIAKSINEAAQEVSGEKLANLSIQKAAISNTELKAIELELEILKYKESKTSKPKQSEYDSFEELFRDKSKIPNCINILKELKVVDNEGGYIGGKNKKSIVGAWFEEMLAIGIVSKPTASVVAKLANKYIPGLEATHKVFPKKQATHAADDARPEIQAKLRNL